MFRNSHPRVADSVRVTQRYPYTPTWCGNWMGFRLVLAEDYDFKTILVNNVAFEMSFVEGGTFIMGDDSSNNTSPAHQVTLSDYYIGQTEVTQALWKAVMGTNPSNQNDDPYKPVGHVSWDDAQLFVEKLSNKTGLNFRLPTEAEWEYAAMGGKFNQGYKYPGSDNIDQVAWYGVNSNNKLHVVGTKMPNELGIYDMSGNVWEWVSDWYGNYSAEEQINPQGPSSGTNRVLRSGSYVTQAARCAIKYRQARQADHPDVHIGFRIVLDSEPHTYVDLGLSVLWATCNVGAESPEDYGDYFAWGETEPKDEYSWATYKWCNGTSNTITKYNTKDGKTVLDPQDDAATVILGENYRMPTVEEGNELIEQCTWIWTIYNNVAGYKITGPNGNYIFLPAVGYKGSTNPYYPAGEYGLY